METWLAGLLGFALGWFCCCALIFTDWILQRKKAIVDAQIKEGGEIWEQLKAAGRSKTSDQSLNERKKKEMPG